MRTTFHPTFLYEALWNLAGIALLLYLDRRFRLGYGRVFALYVMIYTAGRGWIESLRIDTIELNNVLGLRWGVWMSIILFVGAAVVLRGDRPAAPTARTPASRRRTSPIVAGCRRDARPAARARTRPYRTRSTSSGRARREQRMGPTQHAAWSLAETARGREGFVSRNGDRLAPTLL